MTEIKTNYDHVICPGCSHQFRAIPVNAQAEIDELRSALHRAEAREEVNEEVIENDYVLLGELRVENTQLRELMSQALGALRGVENLIEHQFNGTRDAMSTLQNVADDCQMVLTALEKEGIK